MTEKEFINWLRGFTQGAHQYNILPSQWDDLKQKLSTVGKESKYPYKIDKSIWTTTIA
jgi:hypothetical protein